MKRSELLSLILLLPLMLATTSPLWGQIAAPGANIGTSAFFTTTDGVKLHYLDAGKGRPIVFVPGWTAPADIWEAQIRDFSPDYRTVALDPRSVGLSEVASAGSEGHGFPRLAADIRDLIEHLNLSNVVLVGWSMAVPQVLNYIERFGTERIGAVVLVDGSLWKRPGQCANWVAAAEEMESDPRGWAERALRGWFTQPHSAEYLRRVIEAHLRTPTRVAAWLGIVSYCSPEGDTRATLSKVDRPLMYIFHSGPNFLPDADTLKLRVPSARVEPFPEGGHAPFANFPGRFNRVLREFLAEEISMGGRLQGKVTLVTGGAAGIGRATAVACAREGATLVIADTQEEAGREAVELIAEVGGEASFVPTDVSQASAVEALISVIVQRYGRLDCAHNNAGINGVGIAGDHRPLTAEYPEERWDRVIAVNLSGIWLCMKYELQQMLKQGEGAIVNTASAVGLVGIAGNVAYVTSKHGVVGLTRAAALEYAKNGIRINCVCPGWVLTPMTAPGMEDPDRRALILGSEPVGRIGTPEEVAQGVVWLCSDAASFVTGHALSIDGGYVAQ